ncbi:MAG: Glycosyl transferase family 2 [Candidatus Collierbacteria bacterium GW2011_GWF2_42_51]|nr:MAG: Glycosyl transferase family 2 [Candidatus Collierbacteria bacterium GW2011_GWF2_42_51]
MKIGFITINFHSDQDTLDVVKQLEKNALPLAVTSTVYVVDNEGSENLKEKIKKHSQAIYVASPGNIGFAAGNNLGFKKALEDECDLIVLINNDTIVPEDLILKILASPIIYFAKGFEFESKYKKDELGKVIWYGGGEYDWNNVYAKHLGVNEVDKGQYDGQRETDFITGCLFITKAEVLEKVGLFDERYYLYFEDSDLGLRIKKAGYKLIFDSNINLWHKVAQSSGIGSPLNDYFLTRNRLVFGMDYARTRTKIALMKEAVKKLFVGTKAQKLAICDFYMRKLGGGSWIKKP